MTLGYLRLEIEWPKPSGVHDTRMPSSSTPKRSQLWMAFGLLLLQPLVRVCTLVVLDLILPILAHCKGHAASLAVSLACRLELVRISISSSGDQHFTLGIAL